MFLGLFSEELDSKTLGMQKSRLFFKKSPKKPLQSFLKFVNIGTVQARKHEKVERARTFNAF